MAGSPQPGTSNCGAFSKISKLLTPGGSKNQIVVDESNVIRRLSWERQVNKAFPVICNLIYIIVILTVKK